MRCPACEDGTLTVFADMGDVPVYCNVLWPTAAEARQAARGNIRLAHCASCGLVYNAAFDPALISYSVDYENSLHCSPHFQQYADELADKLIARFGLRDRDVLEIGCGKGEFLALLCDKGGNRGIGFDASFEPAALGPEAAARLRVVRAPYSEAYAEHTADFIYSRHVLEHIPNPLSFLQVVRAAAVKRPGAAVFCEVPNALWTLEDLGIWDVIYEHCSYFSPIALAGLHARVGLRPIDVYTAYGNQFLCLSAVPAEGSTNGHAARIPGPDLVGLATSVASFEDHRRRKVEEWTGRLRDLRGAGKRVALWGAGSKGVTFLNVVPGGREAITAVVDINPRKHGKFVPGTTLPVIGPEALRDQGGADVVLIMNPVYQGEIAGMLRGLGVTADTLAV